MIAALHTTTTAVPGDGAVGTGPPHADAINSVALAAAMRLISVPGTDDSDPADMLRSSSRTMSMPDLAG
jgi:hypothetical protein